MNKDMTCGNPSKILFYFAIPMVIGNILQQFYSIVDSMIVGNFVGVNALAAVGASYPITFVFITVANGAGIGCGIVISQYFGGKHIDKMKISIYTAIISSIVFGIILMILGLFFSSFILKFMNTPSNIFNDSNDYIRIYFVGVVFLFLYNIVTSAFNALGNSKTPLIFLLISSIINIALDLVFVINFNMQVKGVAYATLISQSFSAILSLIYLLKSIKKIESHSQHSFFDYKILKLICKVALPSIIQQSIVSIGNLFVQALVNSYGAVVIAGYAAAIKIDSITILPMSNLSNAVSTFTAQNIGAKKNYRVKYGYKSALIMISVFCAFVALILFIFGSNLIGIFVDSNSNKGVINFGSKYLRIVSLFYFLMGLMVITNGVLRGSGDMNVFLISTLTNLSTRVTLAYFLSMLIGQEAIWWAVPSGWLFASFISVIRYKSGKWKYKSII